MSKGTILRSPASTCATNISYLVATRYYLIQPFAAFAADILQQQMAESYLLAGASLSKLTCVTDLVLYRVTSSTHWEEM